MKVSIDRFKEFSVSRIPVYDREDPAMLEELRRLWQLSTKIGDILRAKRIVGREAVPISDQDPVTCHNYRSYADGRLFNLVSSRLSLGNKDWALEKTVLQHPAVGTYVPNRAFRDTENLLIQAAAEKVGVNARIGQEAESELTTVSFLDVLKRDPGVTKRFDTIAHYVDLSAQPEVQIQTQGRL